MLMKLLLDFGGLFPGHKIGFLFVGGVLTLKLKLFMEKEVTVDQWLRQMPHC